MTLPIKIFSDYVCPYCFLAEFPLQEATRGKDVTVEWLPCELRPWPHPTLRPEDGYLRTTWADSVYPLAKQMGVPITLPRVSPQPYTHLAFEGYQYAREHGKGNEYNHRVLSAFFQQGQDIGQIDVLTKLAAEVGLDEKEFREALESRKYRKAHQRALHHAYHEAGVSSVPTFVIGGTMLGGMQSRETLEEVIDAELRKQQAGGTRPR
jgi:predicted DsbA family dithiol-disulfide isomerase